jgi:hypothetical protein
MGVGGQSHSPADLYRSLGGPQGPSERVWKISPPTGIWSSDRPDLSESLYRQPAHSKKSGINLKIIGTRMVPWITFHTRADKHDVQAYKILSPWRHGARVLWTLGIYFIAQIEGNYEVGRTWKEIVIRLEEEDESCGFLKNWVIRLLENTTSLPIVPES